MTTQTQAPSMNVAIPQVFHRLWKVHRPLAISGIYTFAMLLFFMAGIFLDDRIITGAPAWLKPSKFAISITIYSFTVLWFLSFIEKIRNTPFFKEGI